MRLHAVFVQFLGGRASQAEVGDFDPQFGVNQEVSWLDVPMHQATCVDEIHAAQEVVQYKFNVILAKISRFSLEI